MDLDLNGRHVLVTGGSKGIGYACAEAFCREGAHVTLVARDQGGIDAALAKLSAEGFSCRGFRADLTQSAAAAAVVDAAEQAGGPIDVLVNSAGAAQRTPFDDGRPRDAGKFFRSSPSSAWARPVAVRSSTWSAPAARRPRRPICRAARPMPR